MSAISSGNNRARLKDLSRKGGRYQISGLPRFLKIIEEYRDDLAPAINIVGMGSSVGNGASLPDPATQAPVMYFGTKFEEYFNKLGIYNFVTTNRSVDGSTMFESIAKFDAILAEPLTPDITLLAYGMNDGATAIYNSGQTFPFVHQKCKELILKAWENGSDVIIMTTPHPLSTDMGWSMPPAVPQNYPTFVAAPVADEDLIPPVSQSIKNGDFLGIGVDLPASHRHYRVNEAFRRVGAELGVHVIDVERYWFEAMLNFGEANLFDPGQYNHPNLLGHQKSYQKAIDDYLESIFYSWGNGGESGGVYGRIGVNTDSPTHALEVHPSDANDDILKIVKNDGTVIGEINAAGNFDLSLLTDIHGPGVRKLGGSSYGSGDYSPEERSLYWGNRDVGTPGTITFGATKGALILVEGYQSGIGRQTKLLMVNTDATTANVTEVSTHRTGAGDTFTVSNTGLTVNIVPVAANTNLKAIWMVM
ncbi:SGNH hydrolase-type esterase domain protein [Vibrio phage 1.249.A._10N.261.55.B9]|uniref:SGNH hydrolase-type esterase domain protein n=2 Tax=Autolykiviridae TaxID=2184034 RepID=A0A2I7RXG8_9VIRU|nr:tail fiber protein [Vibrio phage 1.249.A._10N.261.55.B9]AUR98312.1 SGNH hydrolase-type esterase domain protein [Vibrio phage 1.249.A._10N.261.55.B9]AUR98334.1 SGNH hydrolase-type esterase domain protein [Vibrio phage 1.249.B._10N.261.55.B9]